MRLLNFPSYFILPRSSLFLLIIKYLKDSFAFGHKSVATLTSSNLAEPITSGSGRPTTRLFLATFAPAHCFDHYGQMVEYLRMNGIVPPASRGR